MPATTRELNVKVIFVVTIVGVMLLIAIVLAAQGGFYYFDQRQADRRRAAGAASIYETYGVRMESRDVAETWVEQSAMLQDSGLTSRSGVDEEGEPIDLDPVRKMPIERAMQRIAQRY